MYFYFNIKIYIKYTFSRNGLTKNQFDQLIIMINFEHNYLPQSNPSFLSF